MSTEENKALFQRWIEAINEGNWAAFDEIVDAGFSLQTPGASRPRTREDLKRGVMLDRVAFPPGQYTVDRVVAQGDTVAAWMTFRGVHSAAW